jgi:phi13 family phage major tail protein
MANKIKYGLKNVHYAIATIGADNSATYGEPVAFPGAVNLSLDAEGETSTFHADNIAYYVTNSNNGYSGSLEMARITDDFAKDILGEITDANGLIYEVQEHPEIHFALLFQFEGDEKATRHVIYNCVASRPSISGSTKEETIEPQTETIDLTATSIYIPALEKNLVKAKAPEGSTPYQSFFTTVQLPATAGA